MFNNFVQLTSPILNTKSRFVKNNIKKLLLNIDYDEYDIDDYALDPESYDWFDEISDAEANKAYRLYEKALNKSKEVSDILDAIDDVAYLIDKCDDDLSWILG